MQSVIQPGAVAGVDKETTNSEHNNADDKLDTKVSVDGNTEEPCDNIEKVDKSRAPTAKVP